MWKAFSCFWKDMLCRKIKKNRFPINKLDWHFPCFGCMWLTRPQKYIALSDATFSKFLETVITYWATAPFPVWTEFIFLFSFFFLKAISVIGLYDYKAIALKQWIQVSLLSSFFSVPSPKWRFLLSLLSLPVRLFDLRISGHFFTLI